MKIDFNKILRNEKIALMSDTTFRTTMELLKAIDANDIEEILNIMIVLDDETAPETIDKICEIDQKCNATVTESVTDASENVTRNATKNVTDTVTRNAKSNAERQKRYRERNKKRNATVTKSVTRNVTDTVTRNEKCNENVTDTVTKNVTESVTRNENVTLPQEERENEKEEEKERTKEKEEERVKEKEELINIYAPQPEKTTATEKAKPQKHAYGSGKNVLLTDEEYNKLRTKYPDADQKIENMSLYFLSKGTAGKYKSHYATFLNWERMAAERDAKQMQQMPKQIPKEKTFRDLRIEMENQEREQDASQDYFVDSFWRA